MKYPICNNYAIDMRTGFAVLLIIMFLMFNGCSCCSVVTTSCKLAEQTDDSLILKYEAYSSWFENSNKENYCQGPISFWVAGIAACWYKEKYNVDLTSSLLGLPYEIISREKIKPKKLFGETIVIYKVKLKIEDIVKEAENRRLK